MPVNKNATFRYRIIDSCLRNKRNRYPNVEYLQEVITESLNLGAIISESSIHKDLKAMKDIYNAPIMYNKIEKGYYYEEENFSINSFPLTSEEIKVLDLSVAVLKQMKYSGYFYQFESTIEKLISGFRISKIEGYENNNILETEEPLSSLGSEWISFFYESILYKQCIDVKYKRYNSDEIKSHIFSPYAIREYRNRWYVIGYSELAETIVTLALDRITDAINASSKYLNDTNFNVDDYFKYAFGVTTFTDATPENVKLIFNQKISSYIISKPLHKSQKYKITTNGLVVEMQCYLTPELEMTILGYGENVKVLAPESLIYRIKKRIDVMKEIY
jgi:predicted DNA-binding transcriptional regulator YafY